MNIPINDDKQFLRVKLVELAHLLIDADVALQVRLAEPTTEALLFSVNPAFLLMTIQGLLASLARPSRWRLELTPEDRRDLDTSFAAAAEHLRNVSGGQAFEPAQVQSVLGVLGDLLGVPSGLPFGFGGGGGLGGGGMPPGAAPGGLFRVPGPPSDLEPATETVRLGMSAPADCAPGRELHCAVRGLLADS